MKFFNASIALVLSLFGAAAGANASGEKRQKLSPFAMHRALSTGVNFIPAAGGDALCTEYDLTADELAQAKAFQRWFVITYMDGNYPLLADTQSAYKLNKVLDLFDQFDTDGNGYLDLESIAALSDFSGLPLDFLTSTYLNCLMVDELLDEDEFFKAICIGGKLLYRMENTTV